MAKVSAGLARRVRRDFSAEDATAVLAELSSIPESIPGASRERPDRIQAALVLPARGDLTQFLELLEIANKDYRDLLVWTGFASPRLRMRVRASLWFGR